MFHCADVLLARHVQHVLAMEGQVPAADLAQIDARDLLAEGLILADPPETARPGSRRRDTSTTLPFKEQQPPPVGTVRP
jgi:hypothetical protein